MDVLADVASIAKFSFFMN